MTTTANTTNTTLFTLWSCNESRNETIRNKPANCMVEMETKSNMGTMLNDLYLKQGNDYKGGKIDDNMTSMSVGDVIQVIRPNANDDEYYAVASVGFIQITGNIFIAWKACDARDRNWLIRDIIRIKQGQV